MTPPMTPREKVRQIIDDALNSAIPEPWEVANHATDRIFTALASGSGDHAELAEIATRCEEHWLSGPQEEGAIGVVVRRADLEALLAENAELRGENETLTTAGIIEVAVRNPSVADYVQHWEDRATEAERKLAEAVDENNRWAFRFADVREAAGIGVKPMLSEVPGELRKMRSMLDRAADLMRQCTDPQRFEGASTLNVYANMRAWLSDLSKEAT